MDKFSVNKFNSVRDTIKMNINSMFDSMHGVGVSSLSRSTVPLSTMPEEILPEIEVPSTSTQSRISRVPRAVGFGEDVSGIHTSGEWSADTFADRLKRSERELEQEQPDTIVYTIIEGSFARAKFSRRMPSDFYEFTSLRGEDIDKSREYVLDLSEYSREQVEADCNVGEVPQYSLPQGFTADASTTLRLVKQLSPWRFNMTKKEIRKYRKDTQERALQEIEEQSGTYFWSTDVVDWSFFVNKIGEYMLDLDSKSVFYVNILAMDFIRKLVRSDVLVNYYRLYGDGLVKSGNNGYQASRLPTYLHDLSVKYHIRKRNVVVEAQPQLELAFNVFVTLLPDVFSRMLGRPKYVYNGYLMQSKEERIERHSAIKTREVIAQGKEVSVMREGSVSLTSITDSNGMRVFMNTSDEVFTRTLKKLRRIGDQKLCLRILNSINNYSKNITTARHQMKVERIKKVQTACLCNNVIKIKQQGEDEVMKYSMPGSFLDNNMVKKIFKTFYGLVMSGLTITGLLTEKLVNAINNKLPPDAKKVLKAFLVFAACYLSYRAGWETIAIVVSAVFLTSATRALMQKSVEEVISYVDSTNSSSCEVIPHDVIPVMDDEQPTGKLIKKQHNINTHPDDEICADEQGAPVEVVDNGKMQTLPETTKFINSLLGVKDLSLHNIGRLGSSLRGINDGYKVLTNFFDYIIKQIKIHIFGEEDVDYIDFLNSLPERVSTVVRDIDYYSELIDHPATGRMGISRLEAECSQRQFHTIISLRTRLRTTMNYMRNVEKSKVVGVMAVLTKHEKFLEKLYVQYVAPLNANVPRIKPVALYFEGIPGSGKTEGVPYIMEAVYKLLGESFNVQNDLYCKPQESAFYEGYNHHKGIFIDDFMQCPTQTIREAAISEFIYMCSNAPMSLNMADCSSKGVTYFTSEIVNLTCNLEAKSHVFGHYTLEQKAFMRRITYVIKVLRKDKGATKGVFDPAVLDYKVFEHRFTAVGETNHVSTVSRTLNFAQLTYLIATRLQQHRQEASDRIVLMKKNFEISTDEKQTINDVFFDGFPVVDEEVELPVNQNMCLPPIVPVLGTVNVNRLARPNSCPPNVDEQTREQDLRKRDAKIKELEHFLANVKYGDTTERTVKMIKELKKLIEERDKDQLLATELKFKQAKLTEVEANKSLSNTEENLKYCCYDSEEDEYLKEESELIDMVKRKDVFKTSDDSTGLCYSDDEYLQPPRKEKLFEPKILPNLSPWRPATVQEPLEHKPLAANNTCYLINSNLASLRSTDENFARVAQTCASEIPGMTVNIMIRKMREQGHPIAVIDGTYMENDHDCLPPYPLTTSISDIFRNPAVGNCDTIFQSPDLNYNSYNCFDLSQFDSYMSHLMNYFLVKDPISISVHDNVQPFQTQHIGILLHNVTINNILRNYIRRVAHVSLIHSSHLQVMCNGRIMESDIQLLSCVANAKYNQIAVNVVRKIVPGTRLQSHAAIMPAIPEMRLTPAQRIYAGCQREFNAVGSMMRPQNIVNGVVQVCDYTATKIITLFTFMTALLTFRISPWKASYLWVKDYLVKLIASKGAQIFVKWVLVLIVVILVIYVIIKHLITYISYIKDYFFPKDELVENSYDPHLTGHNNRAKQNRKHGGKRSGRNHEVFENDKHVKVTGENYKELLNVLNNDPQASLSKYCSSCGMGVYCECNLDHPHYFKCKTCSQREKQVSTLPTKDKVLNSILNKAVNSPSITPELVVEHFKEDELIYRSTQYAFGIGSNLFLTTYHFFSNAAKLSEEEDTKYYMNIKYMNGTIENKYNVRSYTKITDDVALFTIAKIPQTHNFISQFPNTFNNYSHKQVLRYELDSNLNNSPIYSLGNVSFCNVAVNSSGKNYDHNLGVDMPSAFGLCGLPYFIVDPTNQHKIVGIHAAGSAENNLSVVQMVTQPMIYEGIERLKAEPNPIVIGNVPFEDQGGETYVPVSDVRKVPKKYQINMPVKSAIKSTKEFFKMGEHPYEPTKFPAKLSDRAFKKAVALNFTPNEYFLHPYVENVVIQEMAEFYRGFRSPFIYDRKILTIEEAVNGIVEGNARLEHCTRMNPHSSCGFLLRNGAIGKFPHIRFDGLKVDICDDLRELVKYRIEQAANGFALPNIWIETLKDECRPWEKVEAHTTRVFTNGQVDHNIATKMYFGTFMAHVAHNSLTSDISVGVDMCNVESSDAFYRVLRGFGDHFIAGDYSKFDKYLPFAVGDSIIQVVNKWYDDGEENARIRTVLGYGIFSGYRLAKNIMYFADHGMPSGTAITAVGNSLCNAFMMRSCFMVLAIENNHPEFRYDDHVRGRYYGDDNLLRVTAEAGVFFNLHTISFTMDELFGMQYTNADKSEIVDPFTPESEVTYLKRSFELRKGRYYAKLPIDVIKNIVLYTEAKTKTAELDFQGNVSSFCLEMSRWDNTTYNQWARVLRDSLLPQFRVKSYKEAQSILDGPSL